MGVWRLVGLVAGSCAFAAVAIPKATMAAELVRAYVLVEAKPGQIEAALQSLNGLGNCLALTHSFMNDEIVAHLACDGPEYLSIAVGGNVAKSEAVARVTILSVLKGR
jgi:hypothetical protein